MKKGVMIFWGLLLVVIVLGVGASFFVTAGPNKLDSFAQCISAKNISFYGAFWCPHCQRTKAQFGSAMKYINYIECSTPDGQNQTQICKDKQIVTYPTWIRTDGASTTGEHTLQEIADFTGCTLPPQES